MIKKFDYMYFEGVIIFGIDMSYRWGSSCESVIEHEVTKTVT